MRILLACEESQEVTKRMRAKGHEAYSCDILPCSGGKPEWHLQKDVTELLKEKWDMIIAFPPCTHLSVSGARHFVKKRADGRQREAIEFFCQFLEVDCERVVIENPIGIISGDYIIKHFPDLADKYKLPRKLSQIIQPYEHGDSFQKSTCLWIKGLPLLTPTNIVSKGDFHTTKSGKTLPKWYNDALKLPPKERSIARSRTFPGIAQAMADQWGELSDNSDYTVACF